MSEVFASLREKLLQAGVRPKSVRRYIVELQYHFDDLTLELQTSGLPHELARQHAFARLGDIDTLSSPLVNDQRFHGLAAKAPWFVFLLGPVLACAAVVAVGVLALVSAAKLEPIRAWFDTFHLTMQFLVVTAFPVLMTWAFAILAMRQRCRVTWIIISTLSSIAFAAAFSVSVTPPSPSQPGELSFGLALPSLLHLLTLVLLATPPIFLGMIHKQRTGHFSGE